VAFEENFSAYYQSESILHTLNETMTLSTMGTDDVRASVDAALAALEKSLRQVNHEVNFGDRFPVFYAL
jgi:aspartate aminotransferase-like enzyme